MDVLLLTEFGANKDLVARSEAARKNGCRLINLINDSETLNDIENNQIKGFVCDGTYSKIVKTKIPQVSYNRTRVKSTTNSSLINKLTDKSIFLNSLGLESISGSKIKTHNFLKGEIRQPETEVLKNSERFLDYIDKKNLYF